MPLISGVIDPGYRVLKLDLGNGTVAVGSWLNYSDEPAQ
jgi:hypothetical protein